MFDKVSLHRVRARWVTLAGQIGFPVLVSDAMEGIHEVTEVGARLYGP